MQKVVGSNPIIRFENPPETEGFLVCAGWLSPATGAGSQPLVSLPPSGLPQQVMNVHTAESPPDNRVRKRPVSVFRMSSRKTAGLRAAS